MEKMAMLQLKLCEQGLRTQKLQLKHQCTVRLSDVADGHHWSTTLEMDNVVVQMDRFVHNSTPRVKFTFRLSTSAPHVMENYLSKLLFKFLVNSCK